VVDDGVTRLLRGRTRRPVALGLAVVVGLWLVLRAGPTVVMRVRDARETLESKRALLDRLQAELAGLDALEEAAKQLQVRVVGLAPRILSGTSDAEAASDLVGRITLATDRSMVRLTGTDPLPDSTSAGGLRRISLRVSFEGDARGLVGTLRGLEQDPGALLLDDLRVLALDPAGTDAVSEVLRVELTVRGWHQARARGS
jgi:hypothetical protein